ncbi:hypothetical protein P3632_16205 [Vibrio parahaemolyticus]|uniref:Uncharacterized protein n=1 Tax=Vibrio parahaemolyticus TaxID=670 RepID=A0A7Y0SQS1_VIBPH|nr:hypothetical protein [Vibrio parahaemolyticus]EJB8585263.1 hypothetical protein [Vibrio parahaemolyticus]EJG0713313.1 hypothetical protein [Vibrio parahaemolyticus]MDF4556160.1 hypothetical protein [Vibrio parahaemolyticus]MDF5018186.1 hypothetical protein [Vibrio parahaemolyticus]MDF5097345.1 hypothetical protein [Vibrio parahaemolyticus]
MQSKESIKIVERKANPELSEGGISSEKEFINQMIRYIHTKASIPETGDASDIKVGIAEFKID